MNSTWFCCSFTASKRLLSGKPIYHRVLIIANKNWPVTCYQLLSRVKVNSQRHMSHSQQVRDLRCKMTLSLLCKTNESSFNFHTLTCVLHVSLCSTHLEGVSAVTQTISQCSQFTGPPPSGSVKKMSGGRGSNEGLVVE